MGFNSAFKGLI